MEFFEDGTHVRLRYRVDGSYLHADEDGWGVSRSAHRASLSTAWAVHLLPHMDDAYLLLHSAAYGGYLGVRFDYDYDGPQDGYGMIQCTYNTPLQTDIMWEAIGEDGGVLFRPRFHGHGIALHVAVEEIPRRPVAPPLPDQIPNGVVAPMVQSRVIRYIRADDSRIFIPTSRGILQFEGRSLRHLISDLANRLDEDDNFNNMTLCVRAGLFGRLTPLVIDLPHSEEMVDIVVLTTGSAAALELGHPDVDAA